MFTVGRHSCLRPAVLTANTHSVYWEGLPANMASVAARPCVSVSRRQRALRTRHARGPRRMECHASQWRRSVASRHCRTSVYALHVPPTPLPQHHPRNPRRLLRRHIALSAHRTACAGSPLYELRQADGPMSRRYELRVRKNIQWPGNDGIGRDADMPGLGCSV